jgi:hypothetical protein
VGIYAQMRSKKSIENFYILNVIQNLAMDKMAPQNLYFSFILTKVGGGGDYYLNHGRWTYRQMKYVLLILLNLCVSGCMKSEPSSHISRLKEMFTQTVVQKQAALIPQYYHPDFQLYSNGERMNYQSYLDFHAEIYKTAIQYQIRYDQETFLEQGDKVAGRVFITTQMPNEKPTEIEVLLICEFKDDKIYRVWELTYPDWSKLPTFKDQASL